MLGIAWYIPYQQLIDTPVRYEIANLRWNSCRYADRQLLDGSAKNRPSIVDFGRVSSLPADRQRPRAIATRGERALFLPREETERLPTWGERSRRRRRPAGAFSPARGDGTSRGEKDRGDVVNPRALFSPTKRRNVSPRGERGRGDALQRPRVQEGLDYPIRRALTKLVHERGEHLSDHQ
ncbi:hypothetical protein GW17_00015456 [Ensete ventricosum]|nr:hypothetical protein GW17_00015456 [Ensete ventricosum]